MITFDQYSAILQDLADRGIFSSPICSIQEGRYARIYLKHDVEAKIDRAVQMARIEASLGHEATYYFQGDFLDSEGGGKAIKEIASLGHEIGYHYDVLDENGGDFAKARFQFDTNLARFEALGCRIVSVCPHGNPTKERVGWRSNKDFFRSTAVREAYPGIGDVVVDFDCLLQNGTYISDAGYNLKIVGDISGNDASNEAAMRDGRLIEWVELTDLCEAGTPVVVSLHPHRFARSPLESALTRQLFCFARWAYRIFKRFRLIRTLASKWYRISRRI